MIDLQNKSRGKPILRLRIVLTWMKHLRRPPLSICNRFPKRGRGWGPGGRWPWIFAWPLTRSRNKLRRTARRSRTLGSMVRSNKSLLQCTVQQDFWCLSHLPTRLYNSNCSHLLSHTVQECEHHSSYLGCWWPAHSLFHYNHPRLWQGHHEPDTWDNRVFWEMPADIWEVGVHFSGQFYLFIYWSMDLCVYAAFVKDISYMNKIVCSSVFC